MKKLCIPLLAMLPLSIFAADTYQYHHVVTGMKKHMPSTDENRNLKISTTENSINSSNVSNFPLSLSGVDKTVTKAVLKLTSSTGQVLAFTLNPTSPAESSPGDNDSRWNLPVIDLTSFSDGAVRISMTVSADGMSDAVSTISKVKNSSSNGLIEIDNITSDNRITLAERGVLNGNNIEISGRVVSDYNNGYIDIKFAGTVERINISPSNTEFSINVPASIIASDRDRKIEVTSSLQDMYGAVNNSSLNKSFAVENHSYPSLSEFGRGNSYSGNRIYSADRAPAAFDGLHSFDPTITKVSSYARGSVNQGVSNATAGTYLGVTFDSQKDVHGASMSYGIYAPKVVEIQILNNSAWQTIYVANFPSGNGRKYYEVLFDRAYSADAVRFYLPASNGRQYLQTHDLNVF